MKRFSICLLMALAGLFACEKADQEISVKVETREAADVSAHSVTLCGKAEIEGVDVSRLSFGFILSEECLPDPDNGVVYDLSGTLSEQPFTTLVEGLLSETCYYYVAFVKFGYLIRTGAVKSFTTQEGEVPKGAVDLGLSVFWAEKNIGASAPEQFGDYYAWGEIATKEQYRANSYRFYQGWDARVTKYCTSSYYGYEGFKDDILVLEPDDDVARQMLGEPWRMPTKEEFEELLATESDEENYTWEWTEIKGHKGWSITFKTNQNSIFFPSSGYQLETWQETFNRDGFYWTSSLYAKNPMYAWAACHVYEGTRPAMADKLRSTGYAIRPVMEKNDH